MEEWYTLEGCNESSFPAGPFTREMMSTRARTGALTSATKVARVGAKQWSLAGDDAVLAPLFRAAPPQHPELRANTAAPRTYSFVEAFELGCASFTGKWSALVQLSIVFVLVAAAYWFPYMMASGLRRLDFAVDVNILRSLKALSLLLWVLVGAPLEAGMLFAGVRAVRNEVRFDDLREGFRRYTEVLRTTLAFALCLIVAGSIPAFMIFIGRPSDEMTMTGTFIAAMGYLAILVILAVSAVILPLALILTLDPEERTLCGFPAVKAAFAVSRRNMASLVSLSCVLGVTLVLSIYGCGIGLILLGLPLRYAVTGAAYELLRPKRAPVVA